VLNSLAKSLKVWNRPYRWRYNGFWSISPWNSISKFSFPVFGDSPHEHEPIGSSLSCGRKYQCLLRCFSIDWNFFTIRLTPFFFIWIFNQFPVKVVIQYHDLRSYSGDDLPCLKSIFQYCGKILFYRFETNLDTVKGSWPVGKLILESQSKTVNFVAIGAASPIFLQPLVSHHQKLNNLYMP
jgi:hypothetical protein